MAWLDGGGWRSVVFLTAGVLIVVGVLGGIAMADDAASADGDVAYGDARAAPTSQRRRQAHHPCAARSWMARWQRIADSVVTSGDEAALAAAQAGGLTS